MGAPPPRVKLMKSIEEEEEEEEEPWDTESVGSLSDSELESLLDYDGDFEVYEDEDDIVYHSPVKRRKREA